MQSQIAIRALLVLGAALALTACGGGRRDNPPARAGSLQIIAGTPVVAEAAGTASVTVSRAGGSDGAVSVTVVTRNGSATAGQDYTTLSTTVSFTVGEMADKTVTFPIIDDAEGELDEALTVALTSPTGGARLGRNFSTDVTIADDDPPGAPALSFDADIKQLRLAWAAVTAATSYRVFRDPDGAQGFSQAGTAHDANATTASLDLTLYRHDWINARYRLDACNAHGCTSSAAQSALPAMLDAIGYFKASNTETGDELGFALALSGNGQVLAVGAIGEASDARGIDGDASDNAQPVSGAVYVY